MHLGEQKREKEKKRKKEKKREKEKKEKSKQQESSWKLIHFIIYSFIYIPYHKVYRRGCFNINDYYEGVSSSPVLFFDKLA